jgi:hypothetical protein
MKRELHVRFYEGGGVRFPSATRLVAGFNSKADADQFRAELTERMQKFNLELHPEKTRLLEFGPYAIDQRQRRGEGKPETFDFLGFTHICVKKKSNGRFTVLRQTIRKKLQTKLSAHEPTGAGAVSIPSRLVLASHAVAAEPERPRSLGSNTAPHHSLAACAYCLSSLSFAPHGRCHLRQELDAGNPLVRIRGGGHE